MAILPPTIMTRTATTAPIISIICKLNFKMNYLCNDYTEKILFKTLLLRILWPLAETAIILKRCILR